MKLSHPSILVVMGLLLGQWTSVIAQEVTIDVKDCIYSWTAKYERIGGKVVVRIKLVSAFRDLKSLSELQKKWGDGIEQKWNDKLPCNQGGPNLMVEARWVKSGEHFTVVVGKGRGRTSLTNWFDDDDGETIAHEFGHMLGMPDEYEDINCPDRSPVKTGTIMDVPVGKVEQHHISSICLGEQGKPPATAITTQAGFRLEDADDKDKEVAKLTDKDLEGKLTYKLTIAGGAPGKRVEHVVLIDENTEKTTYRFQDQLRRIPSKTFEGRFQPVVSGGLKKALRGALLESKVFDEPILGGPLAPDSLVGAFIVETDEKRQITRYPVEENRGEQRDGDEVAAILKMKPTEKAEAINVFYNLMSAEAVRVMKQSEAK